MRFKVFILALVMSTTACGTQAGARPQPSPRERDVIARDEILGSAQRDMDLYQVVRSLRPHFLGRPAGVRSRISGANAPTAVYVDGVRQNGLEALKTLLASRVERVQYLDPSAAQSEFGPSASGGAVIIALYKVDEEPLPPLRRPRARS